MPKVSKKNVQEVVESLEAPATEVVENVPVKPTVGSTFSADDLAKIISAIPVGITAGDMKALISELSAGRPKEKKTFATLSERTPWSAPPGQKKPKLKRKFFQHGLLVPEEILKPSTIELANKLRPGDFFDNWVHVTRRRDKGIDITYKIKTAQDRMVLPSRFGITSIDQLLQGCIDQALNPKPRQEEDESDEPTY